MSVFQQLTNKFGHCFLLTMSNRGDRKQAVLNQLHTLGLPDTFVQSEFDIHYATVFPYNDIIAKAFNETRKGRFTKANEYDCARNHYAMVKQAYDLGYEYCLIMEDDIQFYNNEELWTSYLDNIPNDWDILQFGGFTADPAITKYLGMDKGYWTKHRDVGIWTTSMYALSRKGMEFYLAFMNKVFWVADGPLYKAPINDKLVNTYICTIPLVIQADKDDVSSDIRNTENDQIDYENDNIYESKINKINYLPY